MPLDPKDIEIDDSAGTRWESDNLVSIYDQVRRRPGRDVYDLAEAYIHADDRGGVIHISIHALGHDYDHATAEQRVTMRSRAKALRDELVEQHRKRGQSVQGDVVVDEEWNGAAATLFLAARRARET